MNIDWFAILQALVFSFGIVFTGVLLGAILASIWYNLNSTRFSIRREIKFILNGQEYCVIRDVVAIVTYPSNIKIVSKRMGKCWISASFSRKNDISWVVL